MMILIMLANAHAGGRGVWKYMRISKTWLAMNICQVCPNSNQQALSSIYILFHPRTELLRKNLPLRNSRNQGINSRQTSSAKKHILPKKVSSPVSITIPLSLNTEWLQLGFKIVLSPSNEFPILPQSSSIWTYRFIHSLAWGNLVN